MKIALFNAASTSVMVNGRSLIFNDGTFIYIPIEEDISDKVRIAKRFPKYSDIIPYSYHGYLKNRDAYAHNDPNFESLTYGHRKRGHGYEEILHQLQKEDILCFYGSFDFKNRGGRTKQWINKFWGSYIFGAFKIDTIYSQNEFINTSVVNRNQFLRNPHFLRDPPYADYWICGQKGSLGLFNIAYPLGNVYYNKREGSLLKYFDALDSEARTDSYYRTAFICEEESNKVWNEIKGHSFV